MRKLIGMIRAMIAASLFKIIQISTFLTVEWLQYLKIIENVNIRLCERPDLEFMIIEEGNEDSEDEIIDIM